MAENLEQEGITHVLEIGPGAAVLTRELLKKGFQVIVFEKDERYVGYLKDELTEFIHEKQIFTIIHADILQFDLTDWLTRMPDTVAICGNIPYNISTPILAESPVDIWSVLSPFGAVGVWTKVMRFTRYKIMDL